MKPFRVMKSISDVAPTVTVDIFNTSATDTEDDPTDATATYRLNSSGQGTRTGGANWTWLTAGNNSDVEVRATLNSGALTSGTTGTWQNLSSTRTWTVTRTTVGTGTANLTIQIRRVSDSVVIDSATVTITATVNAASADAQLFAMICTDNEFDPSDAAATVTFNSSGTCVMSGNSVTPGNYSWLVTGSGADFDIRVTVSSGAFTSGSSVGSWLTLASNRFWTLSRTGLGTSFVDATIEIRDAATLSVVAGPVAFNFEASVEV